MKITTNPIFDNLFNSNFGSHFGDIELKNPEFKEIFNFDPIEHADYFQYGNIKIFKSIDVPEVSFEEDDTNHFHINWNDRSIEDSFLLGMTILFLLAQIFRSKGISNIRFVFFFESPDMGESFAKKNNLHEEGDIYHVNDRLSCFKRRGNEDDLVSPILIQDFEDTSVMIIDI